MSPEIQLVLIGGLIAIASSIATTLLTTLLAYWLENRKERRKLRIEVSKAFGRRTLHNTGGEELRMKTFEMYQSIVRTRQLESEDLAFMLGLIDLPESGSESQSEE